MSNNYQNHRSNLRPQNHYFSQRPNFAKYPSHFGRQRFNATAPSRNFSQNSTKTQAYNKFNSYNSSTYANKYKFRSRSSSDRRFYDSNKSFKSRTSDSALTNRNFQNENRAVRDIHGCLRNPCICEKSCNNLKLNKNIEGHINESESADALADINSNYKTNILTKKFGYHFENKKIEAHRTGLKCDSSKFLSISNSKLIDEEQKNFGLDPFYIDVKPAIVKEVCKNGIYSQKPNYECDKILFSTTKDKDENLNLNRQNKCENVKDVVVNKDKIRGADIENSIEAFLNTVKKQTKNCSKSNVNTSKTASKPDKKEIDNRKAKYDCNKVSFTNKKKKDKNLNRQNKWENLNEVAANKTKIKNTGNKNGVQASQKITKLKILKRQSKKDSKVDADNGSKIGVDKSKFVSKVGKSHHAENLVSTSKSNLVSSVETLKVDIAKITPNLDFIKKEVDDASVSEKNKSQNTVNEKTLHPKKIKEEVHSNDINLNLPLNKIKKEESKFNDSPSSHLTKNSSDMNKMVFNLKREIKEELPDDISTKKEERGKNSIISDDAMQNCSSSKSDKESFLASGRANTNFLNDLGEKYESSISGLQRTGNILNASKTSSSILDKAFSVSTITKQKVEDCQKVVNSKSCEKLVQKSFLAEFEDSAKKSKSHVEHCSEATNVSSDLISPVIMSEVIQSCSQDFDKSKENNDKSKTTRKRTFSNVSNLSDNNSKNKMKILNSSVLVRSEKNNSSSNLLLKGNMKNDMHNACIATKSSNEPSTGQEIAVVSPFHKAEDFDLFSNSLGSCEDLDPLCEILDFDCKDGILKTENVTDESGKERISQAISNEEKLRKRILGRETESNFNINLSSTLNHANITSNNGNKSFKRDDFKNENKDVCSYETSFQEPVVNQCNNMRNIMSVTENKVNNVDNVQNETEKNVKLSEELNESASFDEKVNHVLSKLKTLFYKRRKYYTKKNISTSFKVKIKEVISDIIVDSTKIVIPLTENAVELCQSESSSNYMVFDLKVSSNKPHIVSASTSLETVEKISTMEENCAESLKISKKKKKAKDISAKAEETLPIKKKGEFTYAFTECDSKGSQWRVSVPMEHCTGGTPKDPVKISDCSVSCEKGTYFNVSELDCDPCPPGTYSLGGGVHFSTWKSLPNGFHSYTEPLTAAFMGLNRRRLEIDCDKYGWTPRGDALISGGGPCAAILLYSIKLVKDGELTYTYEYTDADIIFEFQAQNEICQSISPTESAKWPSLTQDGQWGTIRIPLEKGLNVLRWKTIAMDVREAARPVRIRSITISGAAYTSKCTACPAGTYSKEGASECHKCPEGFYSKSGANRCSKCDSRTYYAPKGSAHCIKRRACTSQDFYEIDSPCDQNNQTRAVYRWVEPVICRQNIRGAVSLPSSGKLKMCPPCNPGMHFNSGTGCVFCLKDHYSNGISACRKCPPSTSPNYGHVYQWWSEIPPDMSTTCMSADDKGCSTHKAWQPRGDHIQSGMGHADDAYLVLTLKILGFRGREGFVNGNPMEVGRISFTFELICTAQCELAFMESSSRKGVTNLQNWSGSQPKQYFSYIITRNDSYTFSLAFQKVPWERSYLRLSSARMFDGDVAKIYNINVTNTIDGGAFMCLPCPQGLGGFGCIPCPPGHYIEENTTKCTSCGPNRVVTDPLPYGPSSCKECGPGLISRDGLSCTLDCKFSVDGLDYDFSNLSNARVITGSTLFTSSGTKYFHQFNVTLCGQQTAVCVNNVSQSVDGRLIEIEGKVCRSTIIPEEQQGIREFFGSLSTQSVTLGDHLLGVSRSKSLLGVDVISEFVDLTGRDLHFFYFTPLMTRSCPEGRSSTITLKCDPKATDKGEVILPKQCPDGTCDGCDFHFLWTTSLACPICTESDMVVMKGDCIEGVRMVHYISPMNCRPPGGYNIDETTKEACSDTIPIMIETVVLIAAIMAIWLCLMLCYFWNKNKNLEYKYMKLIANANSKEGVETPEFGAAESCALDDGEEDEIQFAKKPKKSILNKLKSNLKSKNTMERIRMDSKDEVI